MSNVSEDWWSMMCMWGEFSSGAGMLDRLVAVPLVYPIRDTPFRFKCHLQRSLALLNRQWFLTLFGGVAQGYSIGRNSTESSVLSYQ